MAKSQAATRERIDELEKESVSTSEFMKERIDQLEDKLEEIKQREISSFQTCIEKMLLLENKIDKKSKMLLELNASIENKLNNIENIIFNQLGELNKSEKEMFVEIKNQIDGINQKLDEQHKESVGLCSSLESIGNHSLENIMQYLEDNKKEDDVRWKTINDVESKSAENIATMNHSLQEVLKYILSLDEGNRLVIAKLLLQNMEV